LEVIGSIKTDDYVFTIENVSGDVFCHIDITNWSVSIYKEMLLALSDVKEALNITMWCCIDKLERKKIKVALMFGFARVLETTDKYIMRLI